MKMLPHDRKMKMYVDKDTPLAFQLYAEGLQRACSTLSARWGVEPCQVLLLPSRLGLPQGRMSLPANVLRKYALAFKLKFHRNFGRFDQQAHALYLRELAVSSAVAVLLTLSSPQRYEDCDKPPPLTIRGSFKTKGNYVYKVEKLQTLDWIPTNISIPKEDEMDTVDDMMAVLVRSCASDPMALPEGHMLNELARITQEENRPEVFPRLFICRAVDGEAYRLTVIEAETLEEAQRVMGIPDATSTWMESYGECTGRVLWLGRWSGDTLDFDSNALADPKTTRQFMRSIPSSTGRHPPLTVGDDIDIWNFADGEDVDILREQLLQPSWLAFCKYSNGFKRIAIVRAISLDAAMKTLLA